ncbi:MAG: sulfite exporter TauE/SafE family protein [Thermomicrobiales bacterium]|nr:sulfite exporter TauE/SafE family protein [Thermomicrobiales bacterium]MCA9876616.1 sulfite exporter TauE/SafE family protein [Thermomicrobiales bacterium]
MDIVYAVEIGAVAAVAAILGSMLGLGGGVFLVPILTLFFGIDPKLAVGASAIVVVTNSVVGSTNHLKSRFTNLRLAMLLQVSMALGAIAGALYSVGADPRVIYGVFGAVLVYSAVSMVLRRDRAGSAPIADATDALDLGAAFRDPAIGRDVGYIPVRPAAGMGVGAGAGIISGMLGVGGGVVMVPTMTLLMHVPVKAAVGTSSFMVGITSVATAFVYYSRGKIDPSLVVPAIIGVFLGGQVGSRLTRRVRAQRLSVIFAVILLYLGVSLLLRAVGIKVPGQS